MQLNVGAVLKLIRERKKWSQEELAERMHIDRSLISRIETGKQHPTFETVVHWTNVTNAKEVLVAFFCGMDGTNIMQNILNLMGVG